MAPSEANKVNTGHNKQPAPSATTPHPDGGGRMTATLRKRGGRGLNAFCLRNATYQDFMKCKSISQWQVRQCLLNYLNGSKGMENYFRISKCPLWTNQRYVFHLLLFKQALDWENKKESLINPSRTIQSHNKEQETEHLARPYTALRCLKEPYGGNLNPYALNATITTMVRVLQNATNATKLAILLVIVGVREVPTMLTIRGALGQGKKKKKKARNLLAFDLVEGRVFFQDTSKIGMCNNRD
ncbi:hypothetical protein Tco_0415474 [Tanacetum coccineum]